MNASRIVAGLAVCILSCQVSLGQEASPADAKGVLGYFDYSSGMFRPLGQMGEFDSESAAATNPQTGTFVVSFTVTIKSAIPSTSPITCSVSAAVNEISASGVNIITETAAVVGTRTGNTAKCTVTIPYSWTILNPATAKVNLVYSLSGGKATATTGLLIRSSSGGIASIGLPASGSTITQTVNTVL